MEVMKYFRVYINKWLAYSVKERAHDLLRGSMKEHYCKLGRYLEKLKRSNSANILILVTNLEIVKEILIFQILVVCFKGIKYGLLRGFRPIRCIDGSSSKTFLGDCLLTAMGTEGKNQMFSIAWVITEGERQNS